MNQDEIAKIAATFILLIGLSVPLLQDPLLFLILLPVAALTLALTFQATQKWPLAIAAAGLAPLLIGDLPTGAAAAALLLILLLCVTTESPLPFLFTLPILLWDTPLQGILLASTIAFLVAWPRKDPPAATPGTHTSPARFAAHPDRIHLALALALTLLGTLIATPPWAPIAGLVAGIAARALARHPKNAQISTSTRRLAYLGAPLPAILLFLLSALGRLEPVSPLRTLITGWGTIGIGLIVIAIGLGTALLLVARGPWAAVALTGAALLAAFFVGAMLQTIGLGLMAAAVLWPVVVPWAAVGTAHLASRAPALVVWGALATATAIAQGIRILPGVT